MNSQPTATMQGNSKKSATTNAIEPRELLGFNVYPFASKGQMLDFIADQKKILVAINAEKLLKKNEELKAIINKNIGYTDGIGAVLAMKQKGLPATKIAGAEFWLDIIERFQNSKSFYLIGSTQPVIEATVQKLKKQFPKLSLLNYRNGFVDAEAEKALVEELQHRKPDVVFVAQGSPRQELLMSRLQKHHEALYMGLGGSFDVYSGLKKRAPRIFIKLGLEWLYRLLKEPTRYKRQLSLVRFLYLLTFRKL